MYPLDIPGITGEGRLVGDGTPLRRTIHDFVFNHDANEQTITHLVRELASETEFIFYDGDYPSPSDPGAFVAITRDNDRYFMQRSNHGWSKRAGSISFESLVDYLSKYTKYNIGSDSMSKMHLYPNAPKPPKKKKWWQFWK